MQLGSKDTVEVTHKVGFESDKRLLQYDNNDLADNQYKLNFPHTCDQSFSAIGHMTVIPCDPM